MKNKEKSRNMKKLYNRGKLPKVIGAKGEDNFMYGKHLTEDVKKKISLANKGKVLSGVTKKKISESHKKENLSAETLKKMSESKKGMKLSEVTKRKISESKKGKKLSKEHKGKISKSMTGEKNHFYGKHHSKITLRKMSKLKKGVKLLPLTEIHKKRIGIGNKGKRVSPETKIKQSEVKKGKKNPMFGKNHSKEARNKIGKAHKKENLSKITLRKMSKSQMGEKNHQWLGGKSFEPYDKNFNRGFKKFIRNRDNNRCMVCGVFRKDLDNSLAVHHIDYDKLNSVLNNCISLCNSCHSKTNKNRKHWTKFFQSLLNEKYGY